MTTTYDYPVVPWLCSVPLASAAVFDLGVYLVVVGATLLALLSLARIGRVPADPNRRRTMTALLVSIGLGVLTAAGIYLMLRPRTLDLVLGLTLLSYAVNLFIFFMGRLRLDAAPILDGTESRRFGELRRPTAPGAGADRHCHQLCHDSACYWPLPCVPAATPAPTMWTARRLTHELAPLDHASYRAAADDRRAAHRVGPTLGALANLDQRCERDRRAWHCHHAAGPGRHGRNTGLPSRQLGRPVWYFAGAGPIRRADGGTDVDRRPGSAHLCHRRRQRARPPFPCPVAIPTHGPERRFSDRGLVQPVCVFRGAADRILRIATARRRHRAAQSVRPLRRL